MKQVTFMSRHRAQALVPPCFSAIISISTPGVSFPVLSDKWHAVFQWHRADDDSPMTEQEVQAIWDFVNRHKELTFYVHCDAGISRSAAVASFIGTLLDCVVVGLDCDTVIHANAVIKAALMHGLWERQFKEDHIERLCFGKQ